MEFVPTTNCWQVELRGLLHGQEYENVWYFLRSPEGSAPAAVAPDIYDWVQSTWRQNFAPELIWDELYFTDLTSQVAPTYTYVFDPALAGTASGVALPGGSAASVSFRTNARGRSARGRNYLGGISSSDRTGNVIAGARLGSILEDLNTLKATLLGTHLWTWVVLSRISNGAPRVGGLARPVTAFAFPTPNIRSQRRRNGGIGS